MAKKKPFVPKKLTPLEALRAVGLDLDCALDLAWDFLDVIGHRGTLPMTRTELMRLIRRVQEDLAKWDKKHGTEEKE